MFSFFQKKNNVTDIEWLGIDIHSHLLPGIDDGAKNMHQSLDYIHQLQELGFSKLICTPHIYNGLYPNSPATILPVLEQVANEAAISKMSIKIDAAAEYMADSEFTAVEGLLTLPGNYILIEMSYLTETPNIDKIIFDLQIKGYKVILAHPERYNFYHRDVDRYSRLKDRGCLFQLNLLSAVGYYGKEVKKMAEQLLQTGLYDLAGTDLHHDRHMQKLTSVIRNGQLFKLIGDYEFRNKELFTHDVDR